MCIRGYIPWNQSQLGYPTAGEPRPSRPRPLAADLRGEANTAKYTNKTKRLMRAPRPAIAVKARRAQGSFT